MGLEKVVDASSELVRLKKRFRDSPELKQVDEKILSWGVRFKRMKNIILKSDPDIMTFQEMDHLQQFIKAPDLGKIYTCHVDGSNNYIPGKYGSKKDDPKKDDLRSENYLNHILNARFSFAPKSYSNAKNFRQKKPKSGKDEDGSSTIDGDGVAIFWKRNK